MGERGLVVGSLASRVGRSGRGLAGPGGVVAGILGLAVALPSLGGQRPPRDVDLRAWMAESGRGGAVVSGTVRTRTGQGLSGAVVILERRDAPGLGSSTLTDAGGRYRFDRVPVGRYQVFAVRTGFGRRYHGEDRLGEPPAAVDVGAGRKTDAVDVVLPRGAVVTGRLRGDAGLPAAGATVFLLQRVSERGATSLRMAGADRTDDRGMYRVFDLDPGTYYVRAVAAPDPMVTVGGSVWRSGEGRGPADGYAPSFYPGVTRLSQARSVTVGESRELGGVDFALLRVPLASVTGSVTAPAGANPAGVDLRLTAADGPELRGGALSAASAQGGAFAFERVPPGRYELRARGWTAGGGAAFGRLVVDVDGAGVDGLSVAIAPGAEVSGRVRFEGAEPTWRDLVDLEVTTHLEAAGRDAAETLTATAANETFRLIGLPPGPRRFGIAGLADTRVLDGITLNGRDITDRAVTLGGGIRVTGLEIVVTDRVSELRGMVRAGRDTAGNGAVVVVFSTDPEQWFPTSRYVLTERPAQDGRYRIRGVPPGDYWVTAAPLSAAGADDWLSPRSLDLLRTRATRVSVRKGDTVDVPHRPVGRRRRVRPAGVPYRPGDEDWSYGETFYRWKFYGNVIDGS